MSFKQISVVATALLISASVHAIDLGVKGQVYPITEEDIRQKIMEDMQRVSWNDIQDKIKEGAKNYLTTLPKRSILTPDQTYITWIDPSVELTEDINGPILQEDGTYKWGVLFPKGLKVNPLESIRPTNVMMFFDGSDEKQLSLAVKLFKHAPLYFVPIEAGKGDVGEDNKRFKQGVFHAPQIMIEKFKVQYLPALVYAGEGDRSLYLANMAISTNDAPERIIQALPKYLNIPPYVDPDTKKDDVRNKTNSTKTSKKASVAK